MYIHEMLLYLNLDQNLRGRSVGAKNDLNDIVDINKSNTLVFHD